MKKKISFSVALFVLGIFVAGFFGYVASKEAVRNKKIEQEIEGLKQQADQMRTENNRLQEKIAYFDTTEFKEKVAKEKLNMQKPGEEVVVIKPALRGNEGIASMDQLAPEVQEEISNYKKWWNYFFSYTSKS